MFCERRICSNRKATFAGCFLFAFGIVDAILCQKKPGRAVESRQAFQENPDRGGSSAIAAGVKSWKVMATDDVVKGVAHCRVLVEVAVVLWLASRKTLVSQARIRSLQGQGPHL